MLTIDLRRVPILCIICLIYRGIIYLLLYLTIASPQYPTQPPYTSPRLSFTINLPTPTNHLTSPSPSSSRSAAVPSQAHSDSPRNLPQALQPQAAVPAHSSSCCSSSHYSSHLSCPSPCLRSPSYFPHPAHDPNGESRCSYDAAPRSQAQTHPRPHVSWEGGLLSASVCAVKNDYPRRK